MIDMRDLLGSLMQGNKAGTARLGNAIGGGNQGGWGQSSGSSGGGLDSLGAGLGGNTSGFGGNAGSARPSPPNLGGGGSGGGLGGLGDILGSVLGGGMSSGRPAGGGSGGGMGGLGDILGSMLGGGSSGGARGGSNPMAAGGIGALVGALFGGGSSSAKGAMGGGLMAILGSLAMSALRNRGQSSAQGLMDTQSMSADEQLRAGLREPQTPEEEQEVQSVAGLTVRAMINAAKADGEIDKREMERILGNLQEGGTDDEARQFLIDEMRKPMDMDAIAASVSDPQVAAQLYAASLFTIEVDTDAERNYLRRFAAALGLDRDTVAQIHNALGVAA